MRMEHAASDSRREPLRVDIWSDVACPWCWVGKKRLESAADLAGVRLDVTWRAFELNPRAAVDAVADVDYIGKLASKYHTSRAGAQQMVDRMVDAGVDEKIEFRFDRIRPSNTFDAHRVLAYARTHGHQNALKERLFLAYFNEGKAMSDRPTLVECAEEVGLVGSDVGAMLESDQLAEHVRNDEMEAQERNVTGVPFFLLADRFAIPGAQPIETIVRVFEKVASLLSETNNAGAVR